MCPTKPATDSSIERVTPVTIGQHRIGSGVPTYIVAEAGVNHGGSLETALRLVDAAVDAGADAVKFQVFTAADLVTADAPTAEYQRRSTRQRSQLALLEELQLSFEQLRSINDHCTRRSIHMLATPFGVREVGLLVELGVPAIKIASTDLSHGPLLDAAVGTGKPLIVSTGASTEQEIGETVDRLRRAGAGMRLILLHCVSCYPTPLGAINLRSIGDLARRFSIPCGLSDHTVSVRTGAWAVAAGARILEKHFTLDPTLPGPDQAMSLAPAQLQAYIAEVRAVEQALGCGGFGMTTLETDVREAARRSVVAAVHINVGARLTADMLILKRPGTGLPPKDLDQLTGKCAAIDIPRDTVLSWDMVQ